MNDQRTPTRPTAAFVISLIAGLWMLWMGSMMGWGYMAAEGYGGWMWQHHRMMHGYGVELWWSWIGFAAGCVVLVGSLGLYSRPATARAWGIAILAASIVDIFAGAGGLLAGVLGIIGGVLAITWKPWS